jgi:putative transcriptional regulator
MNELKSLEHHFLIAMPSLDNSWFERTVIYLAEDNEHGSMGLVINLPHKLEMHELLEHFNIPISEDNPKYYAPIMVGGPVDMERGFILHDDVGQWRSSMPLRDRLAMTVSEDLLEAFGQEQGPTRALICLGFAGWEPGQLAKELIENSWLTLPFNEHLLFDTPLEDRWESALKEMGVSPEFLSAEAGHA